MGRAVFASRRHDLDRVHLRDSRDTDTLAHAAGHCRSVLRVSEQVEPGSEEPERAFDGGAAGASARREYARRKSNREQRTLAKHPRLGGLLLRLQNQPRDEQVWEIGATGEEQVGKRLADLLTAGILVLHDRRVPGSRANIDHVAVAPSGVWVIDTKRYRGKVEVRKRLLQEPKLIIAGRDKSKLVDALQRQVELVRTSLAERAATVPVNGALCFVDADLPMFGTQTFRGYPILYVKALAKRINRPGPVPIEQTGPIAADLARRFPRA